MHALLASIKKDTDDTVTIPPDPVRIIVGGPEDARHPGMVCFGHNGYGRLGACEVQHKGGPEAIEVPRLVGARLGVGQLACGAAHSLAVIDGAVFAWGKCHFGQLGLGHLWMTCEAPAPIPRKCFCVGGGDGGPEPIARVFCGESHSLAVGASGALFAFGCGFQGALGLGSERHEASPQWVAPFGGQRRAGAGGAEEAGGGGASVAAVAAAGGKAHTVLLDSCGCVWAWGSGGAGQLGAGTNKMCEATSCSANRLVPARVPWPAGGDGCGGDTEEGGDGGAEYSEGNGAAEVAERCRVVGVLAGRGGNTSGALTVGGELFLWGHDGEGGGELGTSPAGAAVSAAADAVTAGPAVGSGGVCGRSGSFRVAAPARVVFPGGPARVVAAALGAHHAVAIVASGGGASGNGSSDGGGNGNSDGGGEAALAVFTWGAPGPWLGRALTDPHTPAAAELPVRESFPVSGGAMGGESVGGAVSAGPLSVACGEKHSVVVCADGALWTCGEAYMGKLGKHAATAAPEPSAGFRAVEGFGGRRGRWHAVAAVAGSNHTAVALGDPSSFPPPKTTAMIAAAATTMAGGEAAGKPCAPCDGTLGREAFNAEAAAWPALRWEHEWEWHPPDAPGGASGSRGCGGPGGGRLRPLARSGFLRLARPILRAAPHSSTPMKDRVDRTAEKPPEAASDGASKGAEGAGLWEEEGVIVADACTLAVRTPAVQEEGEAAGEAGAGRLQAWDVGIVYSEAWRVPALYFSARDASGSGATPRGGGTDDGTGGGNGAKLPLRLRDVAPLLPFAVPGFGPPPGEDVGFGSAAWPKVTAEAHPRTGEPCFMLHPCHTAVRMAALLASRMDSSDTADSAAQGPSPQNQPAYLLSWLSMVGPAVGIHVPPHLFTPP